MAEHPLREYGMTDNAADFLVHIARRVVGRRESRALGFTMNPLRGRRRPRVVRDMCIVTPCTVGVGRIERFDDSAAQPKAVTGQQADPA